MKLFWSKVNKTDTCWIWTASGRGNGYGCFKYQGKVIDSHRVSWFLANKKWPDKWILHTCDEKRCVRPDHLYQGTPKDNVRDMIGRNRAKFFGGKKGEQIGTHKLNLEQVKQIRKEYIPFKNGIRKIGQKYGVNHRAILDILHAKTWRHISP